MLATASIAIRTLTRPLVYALRCTSAAEMDSYTSDPFTFNSVLQNLTRQLESCKARSTIR